MYKTFHKWREFHKFLKEHMNYFKTNGSVVVFKTMADNENNGCNCKHAIRVEKIEKYYQRLSFNYDEQNQIKLLTNSTKVEFRFNSEIFLEF